MRRLGSEALPAADLTARRTSLTGGFGRSIETTAGTAGLIAGFVQDGIGADELGRYLPSVLGVTPAQAQGVAGELMNPEGATIVIVGESAQFLAALRTRYPNLTVIPLTGLNLDSPTLR